MYRSLLLVLLLKCSLVSSSQKITIRERIIDSAVNKSLAYTTISLINAKDSTLLFFWRADAAGNFKFNNVDPGPYLLAASYAGYAPVWLPLDVSGRQPLQETGAIFMQNKATLKNVMVYDKRPPVTINNDTLEFNTENFKTQPNFVVEDMLKKMPGVTVENDGSIKVNGQRVKRVLVNGKEFFTGDSAMATKNLTADAVDKVQVFDRKSDQ